MAKFVAILLSVQLLIIITVSLVSAETEAAKSFTVDYDQDTFLKDGQPFRWALIIISSSIIDVSVTVLVPS